MRQKIEYKDMTAKEYLSVRGRIAGSVKSERKARSSKANGSRPKKPRTKA